MQDVQAIEEKPPAFKREHPALQNMKFLYFFLFRIWIHIPNADPEPDPADQNQYGCIQSRIHKTNGNQTIQLYVSLSTAIITKTG
jgi:hypothetical protein